MIDLIMWMLEAKPKYVTAFGNSMKNSDRYNGHTFNLLILEFGNGLIVKISANALSKLEHDHNIEIYFENGSFFKQFNNKFLINKQKKKINLNYSYPDKKSRSEVINSFSNFIAIGKGKKIVDKTEVFDVMKVCFYAIKSLKKNRKIKIKY